jgi:hypothetical protein
MSGRTLHQTLFKDLPSVGKISYRDPLTGATKNYDAPSGGPGYYRVPTLISAWATAPFLHNNSLGNFNNDPSVKGRLEVFDDAIEKLLWPEQRLENHHDLAKLDPNKVRSKKEMAEDGGLVWKTPLETNVLVHGHQVPSFIQGFTGFNDTTVAWIPWLPSLLLVAVSLVFLFGKRLRRWLESIGRKSKSLESTARFLRVAFSIVLILLGVLVLWASWNYMATFRMIETSSNWSLPWIRLQLFALVFLLATCGGLLFFRGINASYFGAVVCLLAAILFALGFGRFANGQGGQLVIGPFPQGMPVNLVVNMDPSASPKDMLGAVNALTNYFNRQANAPDGEAKLIDFENNVAPALVKVSTCPDLVLDRGHDYEFIQQLSDDEKNALIQLIKTF